MKWQHYLTSVCFAFLGLFVGSFIINQNSVSAVDDISVTYSSFLNNSFIFPNCDSACQKQYSYLIISSDSFGYSSFDYHIDIYTQTSRGNLMFWFSGTSKYSIFLIDDGANSVYVPLKFYRTGTLSDIPFTFTLTNDLPGSCSAPSGSLSITENGTYDVTNYAEAVVEVPNTETIIQGDYHDDLVSINNSIMVCAGVCLVLYFFYCIYRMFIKIGGK